MTRIATTTLALLLLTLGCVCPLPRQASDSSQRDRDFVNGYDAVNADGTVNVVIEIPAGTNAKWEVDKSDGALRWESKDGKPRVIDYLPYPGNYGMVPRTLLPRELGGDGDPLDVIVLGPARGRGSVIPVHLIGVLELRDLGEVDDKLLAVDSKSPLAKVRDLDELEKRYPGVTTIIRTWFTNYKGPGQMEAKGMRGAEHARMILKKAMDAYRP